MIDLIIEQTLKEAHNPCTVAVGKDSTEYIRKNPSSERQETETCHFSSRKVSIIKAN